MAGWNEEEVRGAVSEYFGLLKSERDGRELNKADIYRRLSKKFPSRTPKAFELKFQNISAVLYEQQLPYCAGLKPLPNYQRLLRLIVLDHLHRSPLPAVEPEQILSEKLLELSRRREIKVNGKGSGRFGLAIEEALGIPQNSSKGADFMGIELKTKSDSSLQTLFSRTPTRYVEDANKKEMFARHSYEDEKRDRKALYTSFNTSPDSLGFHLNVSGNQIQTVRNGTVVLEHDAENIEAALLSKHTHTAFLFLSRMKTDKGEACRIDRVRFCKWPSILRFLELTKAGKIFLDLTMSESKAGVVKDHGFLWRISGDSIGDLYLSTEELELSP